MSPDPRFFMPCSRDRGSRHMLVRAALLAAAAMTSACIAPSLAAAQTPAEVGAGSLYGTVSGIGGTTALTYDFAVSTYQLLTTSLRFDDKTDKQKLNFAPGKLRRDPTSCDAWCELTLNVVRAKDAATFGFGGAVNQVAPYTSRVKTLAQGYTTGIPSMRPQADGETKENYAAYQKQYHADLDAQAEEFLTSLVTGTVAFTYGANVQTFGTFGGTEVDLDGDGVSDNEYTLKAWNLNAGIVFQPSYETAVSLTHNFTRKRLSAAAGKVLAPYHTASVVVGHRFRVLDPDYRVSDAYRKKQFIPALVGGMSLEGQWCLREVDQCEDRTTRQLVATPFIEVKVTPEAQFRLGLPFKRSTTAGKGATTTQPIFQLGMVLSSL